MNRENTLKLISVLIDPNEPLNEGFRMDTVINDCRTVGCIAGTCYIKFLQHKKIESTFSALAQEFLDLTANQKKMLFFPVNEYNNNLSPWYGYGNPYLFNGRKGAEVAALILTKALEMWGDESQEGQETKQNEIFLSEISDVSLKEKSVK